MLNSWKHTATVVDRLYDLVESGQIDSKGIALALIARMSSDEVEEFCQAEGYSDEFPELQDD